MSEGEGDDWKWIQMVSKGIEYDYTDKYRIYRDGKVESVERFRVKQNIFLKEATNKKGYKQVKLSKNNEKKHYLIHRLVAIHFIPNPHNFTDVDHKNQEKDDNSISNLRWCSSSTNMRNMTKKRSKHDLPRGVYLRPSGKYQAQIRINGKNKHLGNYKTIEEASCVYEEASLEQITNELDNIFLDEVR